MVAAPARVRERLAAAPDGPRPTVHATGTAIYVDLDGWCLGVVSATAHRVPCALWSREPDLLRWREARVHVRSGELWLGEDRVRLTRLVDVTAPRLPGRDRPTEAPALDADVSAHLDHLALPGRGPFTATHVAHLVGRGPGLTPLGDDVVAGWLVAARSLGLPHHDVADAVRDRLSATTPVSATLLDCAVRGECLPQLGDWLRAPTDVAAAALLAVGSTSGAGLLTGALLATRQLADQYPDPYPDQHPDSPGRAA